MALPRSGEAWLDVSTYPQFSFNNPGARRIEDPGVQFLLPLEVVRTQGKMQFDWEVGYNFRQHSLDEWLFGFAVGYDVSKRLQALAEVHAGSARDFSEAEFVAQAGFRRELTTHYSLLFVIGHGLPGSSDLHPGITGYLGVQVRLGKHLDAP